MTALCLAVAGTCSGTHPYFCPGGSARCACVRCVRRASPMLSQREWLYINCTHTIRCWPECCLFATQLSRGSHSAARTPEAAPIRQGRKPCLPNRCYPCRVGRCVDVWSTGICWLLGGASVYAWPARHDAVGLLGHTAQSFLENDGNGGQSTAVEQLQQRASARRVNGWLRAGLARVPASQRS